ncbi:related to binuclear zinc cluster transcription factor that regulates the ratio between aurofusarin and rubrofusarin biosynthesis [Phialocephala subalpina]|uniref:Related to binuclear zinc cluster transcription factor that regulates the ratio between aurofusarin and rubrofusarin biosynthesis n=1 Tax=Phialocephala subalpina TaxID=576137 RepID=A0A1L7X596_9HELO|nr:related to binuclear zinc cluster transcription factor that regulates the ratio between aurofusarin and rubrofusarin biosynthesis [Phialocephala subalpina]
MVIKERVFTWLLESHLHERQGLCSSYAGGNCLKGGVECVPSTLQPRRRRRQFPESDLLERLRRYEDILRQKGVKVEPLTQPGPSASAGQSPAADAHDASDSEGDYEKGSKTSHAGLDKASPGTETSQEPGTRKTFWRAINQEFRATRESEYDSDEFEESTIQGAWDQMYDNNDHILFGSGMEPKNLTLLHPDPVHIFRLWHVYLDNVNPIFKITHSPTVQQQIIEASSNLGEVRPALEALMFGIYSSAILSMSEEECFPIFGEDRDTLILRYRNGCQQALINVSFLRTSDLQVLTALFLYLNIDPRSLSAMLGMAVRIAQRMGLHSEAHNKECPPFEAEMRRRLWWQIVLFDSRIGEMAGSKDSTLTPAWDCSLPTNVNDADLYPHLKEPPAPRDGATECLFIMLRCEIADWIRHAPFFLDFVSPFLKPLARQPGPGQPQSLDEVEEMIEAKYLKHCDLQIPLHFISSCMSRSFVGKWRLGECIAQHSNSNTGLPQPYRNKITDNAVRMIELDTLVQTCPLTKGYMWFANFHFPFPAYVYLVQELRRSTIGPLVDRAWEAITVNFEERKLAAMAGRSQLFRMFSGMLIKAWEAREAALERVDGQPLHLSEPQFIVDIREKIGRSKKVEDLVGGLSLTSPPIQYVQTPEMGMDVNSDFFLGGGQGMGFGGMGMGTGMGGLGLGVSMGAMGGDQLGLWNMDFNMLGDVGGGDGMYGNELFPGVQDMGTGALGNW